MRKSFPLRLFLSCSLVCLALIWLRKPHAFLNPQFWAEDAVIFFKQSYESGFESLFFHYAGYYHSFPRLVALLALAFPIELAPLIYNLCSLLPCLVCIAYLSSPRISLPHKPLLILSLAIAPVGTEVFLNITNSHWFFALILVLLSICEAPKSRLGKATDLCTLILCGLTGPFVLLFSLLFVIRFFKDKSYWNTLLLLVTLTLVVIQSFNLMNYLEQIAQPPNFSYAHIGHSILGFFFYPILGVEHPGNQLGYFDISLLLVVACALILLCYNAYRQRRIEVFIFLLAGILVLVSTFLKFRGAPSADYQGLSKYLQSIIWHGSLRYFYLPKILLIWSVLTLIPRAKPLAAYLFVLLYLSFFLSAPSQFQEKAWPNMKWKKRSRCLTHKKNCVIPINPVGWELKVRGG